jgi:hypothetical protein
MKSIANPLGWHEFGLPALPPTPRTDFISGKAANTWLHAAFGAGSKPILPHLLLDVNFGTGGGCAITVWGFGFGLEVTREGFETTLGIVVVFASNFGVGLAARISFDLGATVFGIITRFGADEDRTLPAVGVVDLTRSSRAGGADVLPDLIDGRARGVTTWSFSIMGETSWAARRGFLIFVFAVGDGVGVGWLSDVNTSICGGWGISAELETATGWLRKAINSTTTDVKDKPYVSSLLATGTFFLCFAMTFLSYRLQAQCSTFRKIVLDIDLSCPIR